VAKRDLIERARRRLLARKAVELLFGKHLGDRAQTVGALGVSRRRGMIEACGMGEKKRAHVTQ
jgi:hypothetical protein